jgi:hypothetical protein
VLQAIEGVPAKASPASKSSDGGLPPPVAKSVEVQKEDVKEARGLPSLTKPKKKNAAS